MWAAQLGAHFIAFAYHPRQELRAPKSQDVTLGLMPVWSNSYSESKWADFNWLLDGDAGFVSSSLLKLAHKNSEVVFVLVEHY